MVGKQRIYLDNCCYNRPYDDQLYETIRLEAEAKLYIQSGIRNGKIEFVWSFIVDFENSVNPYEEQKETIKEWKKVAVDNVKAGETVRNYAKKLENDYVVKPKDALHLACAIQSKCNYFLTTDRVLLKKALRLSEIIAINPIDFVIVWEGK